MEVIGCSAEVLLDWIAVWSATASESLALAEGVNWTFWPSLRLPVCFGERDSCTLVEGPSTNC
jgi:hypothetical protein